MRHLVISVLICVLNHECDGAKFNGLGFSEPNSRFCQPCIINGTTVRQRRDANFEILSDSERLCLQYAQTAFPHRSVPYAEQWKLVEDMDDLDLPNTFIYKAYLSARVLFEAIYRQQYNYTITVLLNERDASNCYTVYEDGTKFNDGRSSANTSEYQNSVKRGIDFESTFTAAVLDLWAIAACDNRTHGAFVDAAKKRFPKLKDKINNAPEENMFSGFSLLPWNDESFVNYPWCGDMYPPRKVPSNNPLTPRNSQCSSGPKRRRLLKPFDEASCNIQFSQPSDAFAISKSQESFMASSNAGNSIRDFINEMNACMEGFSEREVFVELRRYPLTSTQNPLHQQTFSSAKIVVLTVQSLRVVTVVNLYGKSYNENGYFYVSDTTLDYVQVSSDLDYNKMLLPCSKEEAFAVLLLVNNNYVSQFEWNHIKLVGKKSQNKQSSFDISAPTKFKEKGVNLPFDGIEVLKKTVIDAYFYGQLTNRKINERLSSILPAYAYGCNSILSPGSPAVPQEMLYSIGVCPETNPAHFLYKRVKFGIPTPGSSNDCTLDVPFRFEIMEQTDNSNVGVTSNPHQPEECPMAENLGHVIQEIQRELELIRKYDKDFQSEYFPVPRLDDYSLINSIYGTVPSDQEATDGITPFVVLPFSLNDVAKKVRCKVCHKVGMECTHTLTPASKSDFFVRPEGYSLPTNNADAQKVLKRHLNKKLHYLSVLKDIRNRRQDYQTEARIRTNREANEGEKHLAAAFQVAFTILKTNTAVHNVKSWYKTMAMLGADVSNNWQNKDATLRLINFVSTDGLSNIRRNLIEKRLPFTFLLDASSDRKNTHYVLYFMQTTEGEYSIAYFVGMSKLGKSATAASYLQSIKTFVGRFGTQFETYFKENCIGITTDAASVMNKLQNDFDIWINRRYPNGARIPIVKIFCLSHRLQLISRNSIIPLKSDKDKGPSGCLEFFQLIEKITQTTYTFLKLGSRRIAEFREVLVEFNQPRYEIVELHVERWVTSEYRAVKHFLGAWISTTKTMERIVADVSNYAKGVQKEAQNYLDMLHDKHFLIAMVFLQEYTGIFKIWSQFSQRFAGILMDHQMYHNKLLSDLTGLEILGTPLITSFLQSCKCSSSTKPSEFGCTIEEYDASERVTWRNQVFQTKDANSPSLTVLAPALIKKTREKLNVYLPLQMLNAVGAMHPTRLSPGVLGLRGQSLHLSNSDNTPIQHKQNVEFLCKSLGLPVQQTTAEWGLLIDTMMKSKQWEILRQDHDSNSFWARALHDTSFPWTDLTKRLIRGVKAIGGGTAVVESAFSIFNVIRNQRRSNLKDENVEAMMSVIINGPESVDKFDSYYYANLYHSTAPKPKDLDCVEQESTGLEIDEDENGDVSLPSTGSANDFGNEEIPFLNVEDLETPVDELDREDLDDEYPEQLKLVGNLKTPTRIRSVLM